MSNLMSGAVSAFWQIQQANIEAASRNLTLTARTLSRLWDPEPRPVINGDKRFSDEAWSENPAADFLKQAYLIAAQWMLDVADSLEPVHPDLHSQSRFWTQQYVDALSPTNSPFTNPVVLEETIRTGGQNLGRGLQNLQQDIQQGRVSQVPEDSFELGVDLAVTPGKVIYRNKLIELIQYEPSTPSVHEIPILIVPPWINKYYVMDMRPENSMFKYLVDEGFSLFAISWKNPDKSILDLEWADYMELGPIKAIEVIKEISGGQKVNLVGYCLGGIVAQVTAAYLAAKDDDSINTATFFTTHQDFKEAGDIEVFISPAGVTLLEWIMKASGGYLDGRNMAATFNMLRANDLLWNYVINNYMLGKQPPAFDLLYWNSDGTRIPGKVHAFLVRNFFLENLLMEPNGIQIRGVGIDLGRINVPTYAVAADNDHIVPWQGAFTIRRLQGGPVRFVLSGGGHIAAIVNPPADKKRGYWISDDDTIDAEGWLAGASQNEGSWWNDWVPWLTRQSGEQIDPLSMGSDGYKPIMDAPGSYVVED